jgi:A/G-specific adenine glycosylase
MKTDKPTKEYFTRWLLHWNKTQNNRAMPWKGEKDPYKIWLSEIILQQTRVEQGRDYYNRFVAAFPNISRLAKAPETKVFKLWEGLGYYTRCKNLLATARFIANERKGKFPETYDEILALKGVGPYTAAAIASFAYNLPHAVVDGNVFRVLARYFGVDKAVDNAEGKKYFTELAAELLDKKNAGIYNQALMDFGAVVCKPQQPLCTNCPLQKNCAAFATNKTTVLPVKEKKIQVKNRWFCYFIVLCKNEVLVRRRGAGDIWEGLYEFVLQENKADIAVKKLSIHPFVKMFAAKYPIAIGWETSPVYKQLLSHQQINGRFVTIKATKKMELQGYNWITLKKLKSLPFPKFITAYLKEKNVSLDSP